MRTRYVKAIQAMLLTLLLVVPVLADRTKLKPGWNLFSPQQDVEMGQKVSKEAEAQLQLINNSQALSYINKLGKELAAKASDSQQYPFQFKIVNDKAINAFALPGGFVYVNRGTFEAAANEAQLAGVIAHEIGHVVLRHGTNQVSKSYLAQAPLAILGGVVGSNSVVGVMSQLGIGFAANSILLKYSRDAESQADLMGTQILYDCGYDPKAMAQFFEKLEAENQGGSPPQFFSDHPNPENRIGNVNNEIVKLGGSKPNPKLDSPEFQEVKRIVSAAPEPKNSPARGSDNAGANKGKPARPSSKFVEYSNGDLSLRYPDNWKPYGQGSVVTIAPDGGIVSGSLAYGMMLSTYEPRDSNANGQLNLADATDQLISGLRQSNPQMRITRSRERIRIDGREALSTELSNQSPTGAKETDQIVSVITKDGTFYYFVAVAPQADFSQYDGTFEKIFDNVRFK